MWQQEIVIIPHGKSGNTHVFPSASVSEELSKGSKLLTKSPEDPSKDLMDSYASLHRSPQ